MTHDETSLGSTLRAWRDRLTPAAVGLPAGSSRRAAGLRREELAALAGISVDYVVRLEQGRATTPSPQVAAALARALQLTTPERDHLYALAGLTPPGDGTIVRHIPPGMQRVLTRLADVPAGVFAADWRMVWWNPAWSALLGDPARLVPESRSLVRTRFPTGADDEEINDWGVLADNPDTSDRAVVADLRRASARYPNDPDLARLLRRTLDGNERFAALWNEGAVGIHSEDRKTIAHPTVGAVTVNCDVLDDSGTDLKIVLYTAEPGSEDETKLDLVRVGGVVAAGTPAPGRHGHHGVTASA